MTKPRWWDATIPRDEFLKDGQFNPYYGFNAHDLGEAFEKHGAERWVAGEETGEGGYKHWQCKIVFSKGQDLKKLSEWLPQVHWSPSANHDFTYVEKEGKYVRSWEKALVDYVNVNLWAWQKELVSKLEELDGDDRKVIVIIDPNGARGKTTLVKHLVANHKAAYSPPLPEALDYMAWALAHKSAVTFVLDIPKVDDTKKNKAMWSAVEQMKNGYLYDKRNQWREEWIEPPNVVVITNSEPDLSYLSWDRWVIGRIEQDVDRRMAHIIWDHYHH